MAFKVEKLTTDGAKAVAVAIIERALLDMQGRGVGGAVSVRSLPWTDYIKSVLFLGSSRSTIWFDLIGAEQRECLLAMSWGEHALSLLMDSRASLSPNQMKVLQEGIEELQRG